AEICASLADEWLPTIYSQRIRPQRTRSISIEVPERENQAEIQYTLLGIELQVGKHRFACPDLATARYMRVFARIGCREFAVPYDITKISTVADDLETSWQRTLLLQAEMAVGRPSKGASQSRSKLVKAIRHELAGIGAGEAMPQFSQETKQRKI
ncbi:MAG: hypothetical protein ABIP78_10010, partial [Pyrinomonadaceae bacterium]